MPRLLSTGNARVYRGLSTALEFKRAGDEVVVMFDGSGVESLAAVSDSSHKMNPLLEELKDNVIGACNLCARSQPGHQAHQGCRMGTA